MGKIKTKTKRKNSLNCVRRESNPGPIDTETVDLNSYMATMDFTTKPQTRENLSFAQSCITRTKAARKHGFKVHRLKLHLSLNGFP